VGFCTRCPGATPACGRCPNTTVPVAVLQAWRAPATRPCARSCAAARARAAPRARLPLPLLPRRAVRTRQRHPRTPTRTRRRRRTRRHAARCWPPPRARASRRWQRRSAPQQTRSTTCLQRSDARTRSSWSAQSCWRGCASRRRRRCRRRKRARRVREACVRCAKNMLLLTDFRGWLHARVCVCVQAVNKAALDCLVIESGNLQAYSAYREARPPRRLRALATRAETTMSHHCGCTPR
jgi:hypothetical protein